MDKNAIKKYAVWARRELISRVMVKAEQYGITKTSTIDAAADSVNGHILSAAEKKQCQALIARIAQKDYEQVMEEVAYTWFNRFSALRFMEVNGYLPTRIRVFTDETGAFKPQILAEAIHLDMDGLDMDKVYALKDANRSEELYKYLLITQCNALSAILPGMFQKIEDFTELLFPDMLLREGSVLEQMVALIPEADWQDQVQIIGWLYQYYNTEPKDKVFADLKKNIKISKERIPAATQLFTPDWIVRYMVENSLGRLWIEGHPNDALRTGWKYYLDEAEQEPDVQAQLEEIRKEYAAIKPEEIRCVDPCMGSGHILAYLFDVLMQIYEAYGYRSRDAVASIVRGNLYGMDIDDRAAQLAYFSVMMKARQYDSRFFTRGIAPNVYAICESNRLDSHMVEAFIGGDAARKMAMETIIAELHDAKEYGSILNVPPQDFSALYARVDEMQDEVNLFAKPVWEDLLPLIRVAEALAQKYDVVVTNPPYMGASGMGAKLSKFVKNMYPDSKSDLFAVFIAHGFDMLKENGYESMITMESWMFLSSFEKLRTKIMLERTIATLIHMPYLGKGGTSLGINFGTDMAVIHKKRINKYIGTYNRIAYYETDDDGIPFEFPAKNEYYKQTSQDEFAKIPGAPVAYWWYNYAMFETPKVSDVYISGGRNKTHDNDKYVRNWWEIADKIRWQPYANGGEFRRWAGNDLDVVDWSDEACSTYASHGGLYNQKFRGITGICWNLITSYKNGFRIKHQEHHYSSGAPTIISNNHKRDYVLLAFLNSCVSTELLAIMNPTLNTTVGDVLGLPVPDYAEPIDSLSHKCVILSQTDWDSFETSWDFKRHPMLVYGYQNDYGLVDSRIAFGVSPLQYDNEKRIFEIEKGEPKHPQKCLIEDCFAAWEKTCSERFYTLKASEEELNRIFIDIYGLQDELTPEVADKDVTVRLADKTRDIKSLISYAVGCMFGRYSLDVDGLAYAGGEWDASKYTTFAADKDNIIPICDDEYFTDDIVGRFVQFIEIVYGKDTLNQNLRFIADALGGSGQPKDVIRDYFMNGFYADHLKIYQKRPIYWLFDSGKKKGFKALIYLHRYQPDTIARMRTDYVHEQQARYRTAIADLERRIASASTAERVKLNKQLSKLQEQSDEIRVFEEKIHHLADQMIRIDLDDGVKHNYEIFGDVLAKIK